MLFLVEPDAAAKILADYAILAPERVTVRRLADEAQYRPSLIGGVQRWRQRFGDNRNLMVRVASANTLSERLILLDGGRAWVLGVPFSHLARRTLTTLVRMRPEEEVRKIEVYAEIWEEAKPLVTAQLSVERATPARWHGFPSYSKHFVRQRALPVRLDGSGSGRSIARPAAHGKHVECFTRQVERASSTNCRYRAGFKAFGE